MFNWKGSKKRKLEEEKRKERAYDNHVTNFNPIYTTETDYGVPSQAPSEGRRFDGYGEFSDGLAHSTRETHFDGGGGSFGGGGASSDYGDSGSSYDSGSDSCSSSDSGGSCGSGD